MITLVAALFVLSGCTGDTLGRVEEDTYTPPVTIDRSGNVDETEALNRFFASVPDHSTIVLPEGARYRLEGILLIEGRTGLAIEGNGAMILAKTDGIGVSPPAGRGHLWPRARSHVEIAESDDILIRDLVVRGAHPDAGSQPGAYVSEFEGQHAFDIRGSTDVTLIGVTATDVYGDFVYLGRQGDAWADGILVRDSHFERNGRQGIAITAARNVLFEGNFIGSVGRSMVDIEPLGAKGGAQNVTFRGNTFTDCRHLWVSSGGGTSVRDKRTGEILEENPGNVGHILFESNHLIGRHMNVKVQDSGGAARRGSHTFIDNTSDARVEAPRPAFLFKRIDGVTVIGNTHAEPARSRDRTPANALVYTCDSTDVEVHGNDAGGFTEGEHVAETVCPGDDDDRPDESMNGGEQ